MSHLFLRVLHMSLTAGFVILAVMAVRSKRSERVSMTTLRHFPCSAWMFRAARAVHQAGSSVPESLSCRS